MKANQQEFRRQALIDAAQLLAKAFVERYLDAPASVAALASSLVPVEPEPGLTRAEAAKELKISLPTLDRLRHDGDIRDDKVSARGVRIPRDEIRRYLSRRKP